MFTSVRYLERVFKIITDGIEGRLGGNIIFINNEELETITIDWKKNDKTIDARKFQKVYSYKEFEQLFDSDTIVSNFIEIYKSGGESEVKEPMVVKTKKSRVIKTEKLEENK